MRSAPPKISPVFAVALRSPARRVFQVQSGWRGHVLANEKPVFQGFHFVVRSTHSSQDRSPGYFFEPKTKSSLCILIISSYRILRSTLLKQDRDQRHIPALFSLSSSLYARCSFAPKGHGHHQSQQVDIMHCRPFIRSVIFK